MRGRRRKYNPTIPRHVDQTALPRGIYWDASGSGRWYVIEYTEGKRRAVTVATAQARTSELHRIVEERNGIDRRSLAWLLQQFNGSAKFGELAKRTQNDYREYARIACEQPTKIGPLGKLDVARMTRPLIQRIVDRIVEEGHPTKANHLLRYVRRVFRWGMNRGLCPHNPAAGVEQAKEKKERRVPTLAIMTRLITFARERGSRKAHTTGSVAPYLWIAAELAYLCRLRGIEVITLTNAHATGDGVRTNRRKGSRDSLVKWNPRLRAAWNAAVECRSVCTPSQRPVAIQSEQRTLLVNQDGAPISKSGFDTAWQRLMHLAITDGAISREERFGFHGLKHRGISDTPGTRGQKQLASGHKNESMLDIYDHSVPEVDATSE